MNIVTLLGNIGKDPETRYTQNGMAVTNFSLATNEVVKGEKKTQWHRCVAFDKTAELIGQYVRKGSTLGVEGKISYGSYEKEGVTHYTTDIIVNRIHFTGKPEQPQQSQQSQQHQTVQHAKQNMGGQVVDDSDDIPF